MKLISIVIPVFNEKPNISRVYERVKATMEKMVASYDFEILFTDNHSTDQTFEAIQELANRDPRVRCLRFSANFGFQRSILTGFLNARGSAVIQLDADLEDPPELIPEFVANWEKGYQVVYGVRRSRQEGSFLSLTRKLFYRLINALSEIPLPLDAGDFRLVDSRIVRELGRLHDSHPYLRGTIAALGFSQIGIPYDRHRREAGESKFNLRAYLILAADGILNHSIKPLRLATLVGLITFFSACSLGFIYFLAWFFFHKDLPEKLPPGFTTLVLLVLVNISLNSLFLGIIGEYIGRIFVQCKYEPLTIIENSINIENPPEAIPFVPTLSPHREKNDGGNNKELPPEKNQ